MTEREFVLSKRAQKASWQAIAGMLGVRSIEKLRARYDVNYEMPSLVAVERTPESSMRVIAAKVARRHGIGVAHLLGPCRDAYLVRARREAWAACRELGISYPAMGRYFNRDHTTIMHGVARFNCGDAQLSQLEPARVKLRSHA